MKVRILISGRSYHAAESIPEYLTLPEGCSVSDALQVLTGLVPDGNTLPDSCLVAVSGTHLGTLRSHLERTLQEDDELLVIAPVAGG